MNPEGNFQFLTQKKLNLNAEKYKDAKKAEEDYQALKAEVRRMYPDANPWDFLRLMREFQ